MHKGQVYKYIAKIMINIMNFQMKYHLFKLKLFNQ